MGNLVNANPEYRAWISEVSARFKSSQIKAALKVNEEMLRFYWSLGRDIEIRKAQFSWGSRFFEQISQDLKRELPDVKSFSPRNLRYMNKFYQLFSGYHHAADEIVQQVVAQLNTDQPAKDNDTQGGPEEIFQIPWGHIVQIVDRCGNASEKALFYARKTLENGWSRAVLLHFLDTNLYERQGKAITNFPLTLPDNQSGLAQAIIKDPYNFDFLTMRDRYDEKELKDALMDNAEQFFRELGNGFAFMGREVKLKVGNTEKYLDLLFYHVKLHCYVVIEVKPADFDSSFAGQLGTYVVAVNHAMRGKNDAPTVGVLICKGMDSVEAQYALESSSQPLGISSYELSKLVPEGFKGSLPTIEEIEAGFATA